MVAQILPLLDPPFLGNVLTLTLLYHIRTYNIPDWQRQIYMKEVSVSIIQVYSKLLILYGQLFAMT